MLQDLLTKIFINDNPLASFRPLLVIEFQKLKKKKIRKMIFMVINVSLLPL